MNAKNKKRSAVAPLQGAEVTLVAAYPRPKGWGTFKTASGDAKEIKVIESGNWHPCTDDFLIVANTPNIGAQRTEIVMVSSFGEFLGAILDGPAGPRPAGSIRRLNVISHGVPGLISFGGRVDDNGDCFLNLSRQATTSNPTAPMGGGLDTSVVNWLDTTAKATRDDCRKKFHAKADIALILCNGGLGASATLSVDIARSFAVAVRGYREEVFFHRLFSDGRILERNLTSVGRDGPRGKGYPCRVPVPVELAGNHLQFTVTTPRPTTPAP